MFSICSYAQTREEMMEEFMRERNKMMKQMIQMFQDDFNNDDFFQDDFDPFGSNKSFKGIGSNVDIEEKYEKDGSISIKVGTF